MIVPTATYRLQFRNGMTFERAAGLAHYLAGLGISHVCASPVFEAEPNSAHGYDVLDNRVIDPSLGGDVGFEQMVAALRSVGIGIILDFVPNHMSASPRNPYWRDVLEWGEDSRWSKFFDIDWSAPKLLLPVLATSYGHALENREFGLEFNAHEGGFNFTYGELKLPLKPTTYAHILVRVQNGALVDWARRFAATTAETSPEQKAELAAATQDAQVLYAIEQALREIVEDWRALHELHEMQAWRLTHWRAARDMLTHRRFFEISDLVGLRVERPGTFDELHSRLIQLVNAGKVEGLRLDHIDGLADPKGYLERLQKSLGVVEPLYVVVEKILGPGEALRANWPVAGTTGYEFIRMLAELLVDERGEAVMTRAYDEFLKVTVDYRALVRNAKRRIFTRNLASELEHLQALARELAGSELSTRDFGTDSLRRAIVELAAALPIYRTYVDVGGAREEDRAIISFAAAEAKAGREIEDEQLIDFLTRMLNLDFGSPEQQASALKFAMRFQQTTGALMAKAVEDTAFYRYNRLIALNEVGGEPHRFGAPLHEFHASMEQRQCHQPLCLSATSTHDTKRGEDARARLYVLSEMPEGWTAAVDRWADLNAMLRRDIDATTAPAPEMEWMFYQALAGVWPLDLAADDTSQLQPLAERLVQFMLKAVREAKANTSWTAQNEPYEKAVESFTRGALDPARSGEFLRDFLTTCEPVFVAGALNSLSQTAIKLTAPGIPDIYQGAELWDLSLVDPDNRRPLNFESYLAAQKAAAQTRAGDLLGDWRSGAAKMRLIEAGLSLRQRARALFAGGQYVPLSLEGSVSNHAVAFARIADGEAVITIAPRICLGLLEGQSMPLVPPSRWADTVLRLPAPLSGRHWRNIVTGETLTAGDSLALAAGLQSFPTAVLASGALQ